MNDPSSPNPERSVRPTDLPFEEPLRLADASDDSSPGALLHAANREYGDGLDERAAWRRLDQRLQPAWQGRLALCATAFAVAAVGVLWLRPSAREKLETTVTREHFSMRVPAPIPTPSARPVNAVPSPSSAPASVERAARATVPQQRAAEPMPSNEQACRGLSQAGRFRSAIECFRTLSLGSDLTAEVSLYEMGRIALFSERDPAAALKAFESYRTRFPSGALRGEVDYGLVRALAALGRFEQALSESETLLTTLRGRPIARELHLLRGQLYDKELHDCDKAVMEYVALVGDPGELGDEAELGRARCLEALGRVDAAVAAYGQYLLRQQPRQAGAARQRLQGLNVNPRDP